VRLIAEVDVEVRTGQRPAVLPTSDPHDASLAALGQGLWHSGVMSVSFTLADFEGVLNPVSW